MTAKIVSAESTSTMATPRSLLLLLLRARAQGGPPTSCVDPEPETFSRPATFSQQDEDLVITPARIAFLVLLIGTTLEVLASQGREMIRVSRWRKKMNEHVVVIGYGTKGRAAADTLVQNGLLKESLVIVDPDTTALEDAHADGLAIVDVEFP